MPVSLPPKLGTEVVTRKCDAVESLDWLGMWAVSLGFCALNLAGIAYFLSNDHIGASVILASAATIIALIVQLGGVPKNTR